MCTKYVFLTEPTLKALLNELHPVRASWYMIGLELDIPHTELDCFQRKYQVDLLCEVLKYWFRTAVDPRPTWKAVVAALRSPIVDEKYVAELLEEKYCEPVLCMGDKFSSHTKVERSEGTCNLGATLVVSRPSTGRKTNYPSVHANWS